MRRITRGITRIGRVRYRTIWLTWLSAAALSSVAAVAVLLSIAASTDAQGGVHAVAVAMLWLLGMGVLAGAAGVAGLIVLVARSTPHKHPLQGNGAECGCDRS